jgi:hypothetical protein
VNMPCSPTPVGLPRSAGIALEKRRLPRQILISGLNHTPVHSLSRFRAWIAPPPRKTRFRMAGQPYQGGTDYPLGPDDKFQVIPSSFRRLVVS